MAPFKTVLALAAAAASIAAGQFEENYRPPGEHPALLLNARRLRLLRREKERQSPRWQQFDSLISGNARMPEPGFALALYYQVDGDKEVGRRAVEWAVGEARDLRQLALVLDWCRPVMTQGQTEQLAAKVGRALERAPQSAGVSEARSRVLAAAAIADRAPELAEREMRRAVVNWFRGNIARALLQGKDVVPRADLYALFEMLHTVRDTLGIELAESARGYFRQLPQLDLLSYYPASYPSPENEYRIPAVKSGEPDLHLAELARAADLAIAAYDTNSVETQFLQGWLMHDRFVMRSAFGAPYEFLWANPYQPGLSYYNAPLSQRDELLGRLFVRTSWDDDAEWAGYFDGQLQGFANGEAKTLALKAGGPLRFGDTLIAPATAPSWPVFNEPFKKLFLVGLKPSRTYLLEVDGREMQEERTDPGGIIELVFPAGFRGAVRIREAPSS
jgi:hypothetical protein